MWLLSADWHDLAGGFAEVRSLEADLRRRFDAELAAAEDRALALATMRRGWWRRLWRRSPRVDSTMRAPGLGIEAEWWQAVRADPSAPRAQAHGDPGVDRFHSVLNGRLAGDFLALRDLLVTGGLDVDTVIVGPTGVWVFEVKYWNAVIHCVGGQWWTERSHYAPGGVLQTQREALDERRAPDRQWMREAEAVRETLRRRLKQPVLDPASVGGGLVFTHPNGSWDIDGTARSGYGPPDFWAAQVAGGPQDPRFDLVERLRVLDVLCARRRQLESAGSAESAVALARALHDAAAARAADFVRRWDAEPDPPG